ncbi:oligopeptide/dipeptide ABC transporter, ATPase subunit (plasmid) [Ketogulonicigenium robustum]|uniref:Oligopeptide/dipeptide ABC transporter, ATPase subunit n=1 Tax=Ketogulonicigenium robustum TaxID=92947 RepID=A0A1W6P3F1_9RHOB|nr:ABC transporter ATP-binding protein [Ketogulonicigenium robustum]ARO15880.1 oligopeptide/dipeptide ABC transporter, ATPase subunit [Ketogulonicigenium robustum]
MTALLDVRGLRTAFMTSRGRVQAVRGVDFTVNRGEVLGIVGESGSGKSVTCMSVLRLLKRQGRIECGETLFDGKDLMQLSEAEMSDIRGNRISVIFQDPMSSLNPTMTVGQQVMESVIRHRNCTRAEARARALELFELVRIPSPETRLDAYPHEFSGGMRQRAMIAIALACEPQLLIADEPTTALDVTIQRQILSLIKELQQRLDMAVILITHDLGVIAETADRVMVMYGGMVMEEAPVADIFARPRHPYTRGLMDSIPDPHALGHGRLKPIAGAPPDMLAPPPGCPFAPRCPVARKVCAAAMPPMFDGAPLPGAGRRSRCWLMAAEAPFVAPYNQDAVL